MECYHFIPWTKPNLLEKVNDFSKNNDFHIIFDLEDSVNDFNDKKRWFLIKDIARNNILELFSNDCSWYIRINNPRSEYREKDSSFLKKIMKRWGYSKLEWVVIPKAEMLEDINVVKNIIWNKKIILIIETVQWLNNIKELVKDPQIEWIIFWHHDFFYDKDVFPIPSNALNSKKYREVMDQIIEAINSKKIKYIDWIHPFLTDENWLKKTLDYLSNHLKWKADIGKLSVHKEQISTVLNFDHQSSNGKAHLWDEHYTVEEVPYIAMNIVKEYESRYDMDRWVTKALDNSYISPQMYFMAKKYLCYWNVSSRIDQERWSYVNLENLTYTDWLKSSNYMVWFRNLIEKNIDSIPGKNLNVLEIGAWDWRLWIYIKNVLEDIWRKNHLVLSDLYDNYLKDKKDIDIETMTFDNKLMPFPDWYNDIIICRSVLHYEETDEKQEKVLSEIARTLNNKWIFITQSVNFSTQEEKELWKDIMKLVWRELSPQTSDSQEVMLKKFFKEVVVLKKPLEFPQSSSDYFDRFFRGNVEDKIKLKSKIIELINSVPKNLRPNIWTNNWDFWRNIIFNTFDCRK